LRQCRKDIEIDKANGVAAALQADKTKKSFWQKLNKKTDNITTNIWWERQMVLQRLLKCGKTISREY